MTVPVSIRRGGGVKPLKRLWSTPLFVPFWLFTSTFNKVPRRLLSPSLCHVDCPWSGRWSELLSHPPSTVITSGPRFSFGPCWFIGRTTQTWCRETGGNRGDSGAQCHSDFAEGNCPDTKVYFPQSSFQGPRKSQLAKFRSSA